MASRRWEVTDLPASSSSRRASVQSILPTLRPPSRWLWTSTRTTACWLRPTSNGTRDTIIARVSSISVITRTTSNSLIRTSRPSSPFSLSLSARLILTKWMRWKERECPIIRLSLAIEIFMESLVGSPISTSSALRIMMRDTLLTENISMDPWTITSPSIIQPWLTPSSSDKMLPQSLWLEREFKPWVFRTDRSMARRWDRHRAPSRHQFTRLLSFSTVMSLTDGRTLIKLPTPSNSRILFLSWERLILSGRAQRGHPRRALTTQIRHTLPALMCPNKSISSMRRREWDRYAERTAGTPTSSLSQSTMNKFTRAWRSLSKESEKNAVNKWRER